MPNKFKFGITGNEQDSLFQGDIAINISPENTGGGPSSTTKFYNGATVPLNGYVVYHESGAFVANNDTQLLEYINTVGGDSSSVANALEWAANEPSYLIVNRDIKQVPTEGLQLFLDAKQSASYTEGSKWHDLANGIRFNMIDSPLPNLNVDGADAFAFNNSGYWESEEGHDLVDMGGDMTLLMWVNSTDITERDTIFEKAGVQYQSYEHEIAVTWETNEGFSWYSRKNQYGYGRTNSIGQSGWCLVGIKMSTGKVQGQARQGWWSINGSNWNYNYTDRGANAILPAGPIRIGRGYAGPVESGAISMVMVWDRMLTDSEVSNIFNNQRSIYGI